MTATGQKDGTTIAAACGDLTTGDPGSEMDGSWVADRGGPSQDFTDIRDEHGHFIATIFRTGPNFIDGPRQRARVQMILASPDMLAALETAEHYIKDIRRGPHETAALKKIRAAIAKATCGQS